MQTKNREYRVFLCFEYTYEGLELSIIFTILSMSACFEYTYEGLELLFKIV